MPQSGYGAYGLPAAKRAYAYGWFGARRRWHKGVHYGYHGRHTQWSFR